MAQMAEAKPQILETGIPNLDRVLGGGFQQHNSYIIAGPSGAGKSVLSLQIAFHRARTGDRVLLVTGLAEPHRNLLEHMSTLRFTDSRMIGPQIETVSIVPFLERSLSEKIDVLRNTVLNTRPRLVVVDGLRSLEAFAGGPSGVYQFLYGLTSWLALEGITLLMTKEIDPGRGIDDPDFSLVDGVVMLRNDLVDGHSVRRLWVQKMRGQVFLAGLHSFTLDENGIRVWPRPESPLYIADRPLGEKRASFGLPSLDAMLEGGVREGTSTLLAGDAGTGKTVAALAFLGEGARLGQPGLWVGFRGSRSRLLALNQASDHDLKDAEARGAVQFVNLEPIDLEFSALANLVQNRVAEVAAVRLVLDAAEALEHGLPGPRSAAAWQTWLIGFLAERGITSLIAQRLPRPCGQELHISDTPLAYLAENVIVFRHIERDAQLHRVITILKMAGSGYDPTTREFTLDQRGITVGDPFAVDVGSLTPRASREPATLKGN